MQSQNHWGRLLRIVAFWDVGKVGSLLLAHHNGAGVIAGAERVGGEKQEQSDRREHVGLRA